MKLVTALALLLPAVAGACMSMEAPSALPAVGRIVAEPGLEAVVDPNARIEQLADGFDWSEGPVWIRERGYLLLSDVPANTMYRWSERDGASVFLRPSGYAGSEAGIFREPGSNGLIR